MRLLIFSQNNLSREFCALEPYVAFRSYNRSIAMHNLHGNLKIVTVGCKFTPKRALFVVKELSHLRCLP